MGRVLTDRKSSGQSHSSGEPAVSSEPRAVTISRRLLLVQGYAAGCVAALSLIAALLDPSSVGAGFAALGVIWFTPPSLALVFVGIRTRKRRRADYLWALVVHLSLTIVFGLPLVFGLLDVSYFLLWRVNGFSLIAAGLVAASTLISSLNAVPAIGLLRAGPRSWFGIGALSEHGDRARW